MLAKLALLTALAVPAAGAPATPDTVAFDHREMQEAVAHDLQYPAAFAQERSKDGSEVVAGPGSYVDIPPGHRAWVVGDEECVLIDWD